MTDEALSDPYAVVLADLKAQREKIDAAISAIESLRGVSSTPPQPAAEKAPVHMGAGAFLGMSIPDAAKKLLAHERRAMANPEIWEKLKAGGLHLNSADPVNTVGSVLSRRFDKIGDIVRVGRGTWGLVEWYPGRNFKKPSAPDPSRPTDNDLRELGLEETLDAPDPAAEDEFKALLG
jgi:hypothetical protein